MQAHGRDPLDVRREHVDRNRPSTVGPASTLLFPCPCAERKTVSSGSHGTRGSWSGYNSPIYSLLVSCTAVRGRNLAAKSFDQLVMGPVRQEDTADVGAPDCDAAALARNVEAHAESAGINRVPEAGAPGQSGFPNSRTTWCLCALGSASLRNGVSKRVFGVWYSLPPTKKAAARRPPPNIVMRCRRRTAIPNQVRSRG